MGIVPRPWHGLNISGRDQRTLQVTGAPLDELRTVVGELPFLFVEVDGVAHDGADRRRGDDVGVKAVLVHRLLLFQRRAVRHVHGLAECPLDVVVVGRQVEEILMEELDVRLGLHREIGLQLRALGEERDVAVQYVYLVTKEMQHHTVKPQMTAQPPMVASTVIMASLVFCASDSMSIFLKY